MILCVSFVSLCRIQALQGCFLSIRMQSTWCSPGISGFVALEGTVFGGGEQARTSCITIQQISSVPNGLFPLLLGSSRNAPQVCWLRLCSPCVSVPPRLKTGGNTRVPLTGARGWEREHYCLCVGTQTSPTLVAAFLPCPLSHLSLLPTAVAQRTLSREQGADPCCVA